MSDIIIEYTIGYDGQPRVTCRGKFRDWKHFEAFKSVEANYHRIVRDAVEIVLEPPSDFHGGEE